MLVYQDRELKVYTTNNLLLILKGDNIIKEMYIEDKCLVDDIIIELKEKKQTISKVLMAR